MEKFILASFCNLPLATVSPVVCMKIQTEGNEPVEFAPVTLGYPGSINSAIGMHQKDGRIFVAFGAEGKNFVAVLNEKGLDNLFYQDLPEAVDVHSILATEKYLYVVSTGTDQVLRYEIGDNRLGPPCCIWEASQTHSDTHHINAILEMDGEIYISAFGPKAGQLWVSATQGYVHNITRDQHILEGIHHPHSLSVRDHRLYFCESHQGTFCSQEGPIFKLDGYSRGIIWLSDQLVAVATSIGRKVSKSTGIFANPADPGEKAGTCSLNVKAADTGNTLTTADLSWFGPEVYDLLALDSPVDLLQAGNRSYLAERERAGAHRRALNEVYVQYTASHRAVQELAAKIEVSQQAIQALHSEVEENQRTLQSLTEKSGAIEQANQALTARINEIERSKAWETALWMQRTRVKLAPPKSHRELVLRWIYRTMMSQRK